GRLHRVGGLARDNRLEIRHRLLVLLGRGLRRGLSRHFLPAILLGAQHADLHRQGLQPLDTLFRRAALVLLLDRGDVLLERRLQSEEMIVGELAQIDTELLGVTREPIEVQCHLTTPSTVYYVPCGVQVIVLHSRTCGVRCALDVRCSFHLSSFDRHLHRRRHNRLAARLLPRLLRRILRHALLPAVTSHGYTPISMPYCSRSSFRIASC